MTATALQWSYTTGGVIINQNSDLTINADVTVTPDSRGLTGSGLWKVGFWGSQNADGSGAQSDYRSQILSGAGAGTALVQGRTLELSDIETSFDIASMGCGDYSYMCLEFGQGDSPSPAFKYNVLGRGDGSGDQMLQSCVEVQCNKGM